MTAPRYRATAALVSAFVVFFAAVVAMIPARAHGRLRAVASVVPRIVPSGRATSYIVTVRNTSSPPGQRIGSIRIAAPAQWTIEACGPDLWTARPVEDECWFESDRGRRDDIHVGQAISV